VSYKAYAYRLASYGYAVVQYDTAFGTIITDNVEVRVTMEVGTGFELIVGTAAVLLMQPVTHQPSSKAASPSPAAAARTVCGSGGGDY
jgi:hypothetical protein